MRCRKCGHVGEHDDLVCPACGAVHAKVAAAAASGEPIRMSASRPAPLGEVPRRVVEPVVGLADFLRQVRAQSAYPVYRIGVRVTYWVAVVVVLLVVVFNLIREGLPGGLSEFGWGLLVLVALMIWRETMLLVADVGDAAMRAAWSLDRTRRD